MLFRSKYLQKVDLNVQSLPPAIIDGWIASLPEKLSINTVNIYISAYIQFAKYLRSLRYDAFIPEKAIGSKNYSPYIFHEDDLAALIQASDILVFSASEKHRHNAACFSVMLRMYIGCGFRLNEIRLLKTNVKVYSISGIPQKENWFFPSGTGNPISCSWIRDAFLKCIQHIGIERPDLPKHARDRKSVV